MAARGGEPAGQASSNEQAEPRGGCGAAEPRMASRCPASPLQDLGQDSQPRGTSPPPSGLRGSPITLWPCQGLRLPSGPPCCPRRNAKDSALQAEGRESLGGLHGDAWGTRVAQLSPSSLRKWSLMGREDDGGGSEPSSSSMLMKHMRVSKLMTLDQNPLRMAGPGDSLSGRLVCIKECGGGLLAGEVWKAGFLVLTPSPRPGRCSRSFQERFGGDGGTQGSWSPARLPDFKKPAQQLQLTIVPIAPE